MNFRENYEVFFMFERQSCQVSCLHMLLANVVHILTMFILFIYFNSTYLRAAIRVSRDHVFQSIKMIVAIIFYT